VVNENSYPGVKEVYFGEKLPPYPFMYRGKSGVVMPTKKILAQTGPRPAALPDYMGDSLANPRVESQAQWNQGGRWLDRQGVAVNWVQSPHPVPLSPKDVVISDPAQLQEVATDVRKRRLRTIPEETFYKALAEIHPASEDVYGAAAKTASLAEALKQTVDQSYQQAVDRHTPEELHKIRKEVGKDKFYKHIGVTYTSDAMHKTAAFVAGIDAALSSLGFF
jgi:hypothetical protein